jgi:signal transduction histidine kinase
LLVKRGDELKKLTTELQTQRDEMAVMKDHLQVGIFLMDKDYTIQPLYSQALETILDEENLQGRNFIDLMISSIGAQKIEILKKYFAMLFSQSDKQALDDINPLREFEYSSLNNTGGALKEAKSLRTAFSLIDRGADGLFIMGTLEDFSKEKELQEELSEADARRQEDLNVLFEALHIGPQALGNFIEDTDSQLAGVNELLKDPLQVSKPVMLEVFESIHVMKLNAQSLGMDDFSKALHGLESDIKTITEQDEIPFEDVFRLSVEINQIMGRRDRFRNALARISSLNLNGSSRQTEDMFVLSLRNICEETAATLGKKVSFAASVDKRLGRQALESDRGRVIKEALAELARNAVYHGIETPAERSVLGKDETGSVRLSIRVREANLHLRLEDDGQGLDFDSILAKAERRGLIHTKAESSDYQLLLRLIFEPEFSTLEEGDLHAGHGIGLSLVRRHVIELHGSIKVQTAPGKGSAFNLYIPMEGLNAGDNI